MRGRAVLVLSESERPQPWLADRRGVRGAEAKQKY
jgi:hypothetical protein